MNQRVLITGAACGLGWALTQLYLRNGWFVVMVDLDEDRLAEREAVLRDAHSGRFQCLCVNVTNEEQLSTALDPIINAYEGLDLLINNAGITHRSQASVTDPDVFDRVMSVNWRAPVRLTRICLSALQRQNGAIICISSMAAWMPVPGRAAYGASKAALKLHFEAWRPELRQKGISLLMVYPSFVATSIEKHALGSDGQPTTRLRSAIGRVQTADDMALSIFRAQQKGRQRLYGPQWSSHLGALLWFHAPKWYQRTVWRKFAVELESLEDIQSK